MSTELTRASWSVLDQLTASLPEAIVIGGWGTWARLQGPESHDIDIVLDRAHHRKLQALSSDWGESSDLGGRKRRATVEGIHVDCYAPYVSRLDRVLELRVEDLVDAGVETLGPHRVLILEAHLCTKIAALLDRPSSQLGIKDRIEILGLLRLGAGIDRIAELARSASQRPELVGPRLIEAFHYLADLSLDRGTRRWLGETTPSPRGANRGHLGRSHDAASGGRRGSRARARMPSPAAVRSSPSSSARERRLLV